MPCEQHEYEFAGLRFSHGSYPRGGSGSFNRYYANVYFCKRCLDTVGKDAGMPLQSSYEKPLAGSMPGTQTECLVPDHDREFGRR